VYRKLQQHNNTDIEEFFGNIEEALDINQLRDDVNELSSKIDKVVIGATDEEGNLCPLTQLTTKPCVYLRS
jgi:hypothetical protein